MAYNPLYIAPLRIRTEQDLDQMIQESMPMFEAEEDLLAGFSDAYREIWGDPPDEPVEPPPDDPKGNDNPLPGGGGGPGPGPGPGGGGDGAGGDGGPPPPGPEIGPDQKEALRELLLDMPIPGMPGEGDPVPTGGGVPAGGWVATGGDQAPQLPGGLTPEDLLDMPLPGFGGEGGVPLTPEQEEAPPGVQGLGGPGPGEEFIIPGPYHGNPPREVEVGIQSPERLPKVPGFDVPDPMGQSGVSFSVVPSSYSSLAARSARDQVMQDLEGQRSQFLGATTQMARDVVGGVRTPYGPSSRQMAMEDLMLRPPKGLWGVHTKTDGGHGGGPDG